MRGIVRKLLREPLVHFLLIGAALFAIYRARGGASPEPAGRIVIGAGQVERLALTFSRVYMRPPTVEELQGLIEKEIREEVYSREAMAMGLDRDDEIIRRRLQQKIEFLSEDVGAQQQPTDAQLQEHLDRHPERFRTDAIVTFRQVYAGDGRDDAAFARKTQDLLTGLRRAGARADLSEQGERLALSSDYVGARASDVARDFGPAFAEKISTLPIGRWEGPIASGYGQHLVLVSQWTAGTLPPLSDVREAVLRDWQSDRRQETNRRFYETLRAKYSVTVELPDWAKAHSK